MKIKDLERTVNVAWSPAPHYPILLAAGTAAQQLDASFSTNASLEVYSINLADPGLDMELKASTSSDNRFYKVVWGSYGMTGDKSSGVIVGGCDGGLLQIYNAAKLLAGEDCLISRQDKHTGPVQALDFNPFQNNLLASGAAESEIYIWDLNNTNTPMTPGTKSQPYETVQCLSWNRQVQHILATTFSSRCVVWDLRKNEPIIKLTDTSSHIRWKYVSWHPEVATQLCLASEEDQAPVIQLWDLRFATSPLKVLDSHQRGVMSVAWCVQDPDLLISCGKDNRILCWNPNSNQQRGEVLSEVAHTLQWNFDVAWCPRNPAIIAASSFDGHVSVYSLMGGKQQQVQTSNKIADSFPGMDGYIQAPVPQQAPPVSVDLSKAPKWLKKPVGASFAFGGKLITFENDKSLSAAQNQQQLQAGQVPPLVCRSVKISQVITEPELINQANDLEQALQMGNFSDYCRQKADASNSQHERYVWHFIKANFETNPKLELLNLLGFYPEDINNVMCDFAAKRTADLNLSGDTEEKSDDNDANSSAFDAIAADNKMNENMPRKLSIPFKIKTGDDTDGLITQAILVGNIEAAVELCLESNRMADALIIAMTGGSDLLARTQHRYLQQSEGYVSALISALVSEDWSTLINQCSVESWKEALAAALTYCPNEELPLLCERLGERLEAESNGNKQLLQDAQLCYICAGSFNKLVASWTADVSSSQSPQKLQELVELVTFMQKAIEQQGRPVEVSGNLADLLSHYAILLASQGNLNNALNYLGTSSDPNLSELRERLYCNLGHKPAYSKIQQQQQQQQNQSYGSRRISNPRQSNPAFNATQPNQFPPQNAYNQPAQVYQPQKFNTGLPNAMPAQPLVQPGLLQQQPPQSWNNNAIPPPSGVNAVQQQPFGALPPKTFSPAPAGAPPPQPPRPTSVGSTHGSTPSLSGRNKYVVDPSVQSNMPASMPYGAMRNPYNAPNSMGNVNPVPMLPTNPLIPSSPSAKPAMAPTYPNMNPIQNQPTIGSFPPVMSSTTGASMYNPNANTMGNVEVAQPAINALPPLNGPPGWNDPPVVSKNARPQNVEHVNMSAEHAGTRLWKLKVNHEPKPEFSAQSPITHPLYGTAADTPINNGYGEPPTGPYGQMPPPGPQTNHFAAQQPMQQQFHHSTMHQQQQQQQQQPQAAPEPPKSKGPVPEEHMYLQTVFDELRTQCTCAANNPQTKRKLDDVTRKLETLYDMLREHKLSPQTLSGLHQMVQMVQVGDYTGGLGLHTQLVSGPDFAQIASFMPGLKVLLQCALQLQVYIR